MLGFVGLVLKWLFIVLGVLFVLAFVLGGPGGTVLIEVPFVLVFGWIRFLHDNLAAMRPDWLRIAEAAACIALLGLGGHRFAAWLWREMAPAGAAPWRTRWTVAGMGSVLLLFVAGIGTIGVTHQAAWLFGGDIVIVDAYTDRARMSEVLLAASGARTAVNEFYGNNRRLPESGKEAGFEYSDGSKYARSVGIGPAGRVTIEVVESLGGGGRVYLTPSVGAEKLEWKCTSDMPRRTLPASCRD